MPFFFLLTPTSMDVRVEWAIAIRSMPRPIISFNDTKAGENWIDYRGGASSLNPMTFVRI